MEILSNKCFHYLVVVLIYIILLKLVGRKESRCQGEVFARVTRGGIVGIVEDHSV